MRKLLSILLCLCLLLCLASCGEDSQKSSDESKATTDAPTTEATEPSTEATDPSTEATEPSTEATEPSTEATEPSTEATEPSTEPSDPIDPALPVDWTEMKIQLDGQLIQLPCSFSTFTDLGWTLYGDVSAEDLLPGNDYNFITMAKGDYSIMLLIANYSGNAQRIDNCEVCGFSTSDYDGTPIILEPGLTNSSTAQDFIAAWGEPEEISYFDEEAGTIFNLDYVQEGEDLVYYANLYFSDVTGMLASIDMQQMNYGYFIETETSAERPAYLDEYIAPSELGTDNTVPVFQLDGVIYQLPCPLEQFLNNGWECDDPEQPAPGYGTAYLELTKGDILISVNVTNFDTMQQMVKHCPVTDISFYGSDFETVDEDVLFIPGNVGFSQIHTQADTLFADFEKYEYDGGVSYTHSTSDFEGFWFYNCGIDFYYDAESTYLSISNNRWNYG